MKRKFFIFPIYFLYFLISAEEIRVFNCWYTYGENTTRLCLEYYKKLGYTHVFVPIGVLLPDPNPHLNCEGNFLFKYDSSSGWKYNNGNYTSGCIAEKFMQQLRLVKSYGLIPIPIIATLSYCSQYIYIDSTVSEFGYEPSSGLYYKLPDKKELIKIFPMCEEWTKETWEYYFTCRYHLAKPDSIGGKGNERLYQIYREFFNIIKYCWKNVMDEKDTMKYIHLCHDELGYRFVCFVKLGKSRNSNKSRAELIALEIESRIRQIDTIFGDKTQIMLYGDSFLPADYGETYQTAGDLYSGEKGVLKLLDSVYGRKKRIIILPWIYSYVDGYYDDARRVFFDKRKQIEYLGKLGYRFLPCGGEDGGEGIPPIKENINKVKQTIFEWVKAAQNYPQLCIGYGHLTWGSFSLQNGDIYNGYSASLFPYLCWTYRKSLLPTVKRMKKYNPGIFKNVNFIKSRKDTSWIEGIHYHKPDFSFLY